MEPNTSMGWPLTLPLRRSPPDLVYTPIEVPSVGLLFHLQPHLSCPELFNLQVTGRIALSKDATEKNHSLLLSDNSLLAVLCDKFYLISPG